MSDMIASAAGSLAMMTSALVSPEGRYEYEAAHGTVQRHYYRYLQGEKPSTNPTALIFAWAGALEKRAVLDGIAPLEEFAKGLRSVSLQTIESGRMTGDLAASVGCVPLNSWEFIDEIARGLRSAMK
jgi:isocitrate dehydrogenase